MASYLQGDQPYLPQVQPWSPDFNFYQKAMSQKQQQYDIGWQKVNTLYNSLLNAPMLREDDIARRDQFFKTIEGEIHKLSGIDLSKPQNVDAASQVFKPLIQDDYIINDIKWTKKYQKEMSRAEYFRNCIDPKKCGGKYWEEGERALQYRAQDFKNASADKALQMAGPKYTPYSNAMEKAFDKIKEMGFGDKGITYSDGKWMITEKAGKHIVEPLMSYLAKTVGRDPEVLAMYNTKAYVNRKDWLSTNEGNYASPEEANTAYYQNFLQPATSTINNVAADVTSHRKTKESEVALIESDIKKNGMVPDSDEHKEYKGALAELAELMNIEQELEEEKSVVNNISNSTNADVMTLNSDRAIANALLYNDLFQAASTYQQLSYEREIKGADPYALANYNSSLRQNENRQKAIYDMALEIWKDKKEAEKALKSSFGGADQSIWELKSTPDATGSTSESQDLQEYNEETVNKFKNDLINSGNTAYLSDLYGMFMADNTLFTNKQKGNDFINIFMQPLMKNNTAMEAVLGKDLADKIKNDQSFRQNNSKLLRAVKDRISSLNPEDIAMLDSEVIKTMVSNADRNLRLKNDDGIPTLNGKKDYVKSFYNTKGADGLPILQKHAYQRQINDAKINEVNKLMPTMYKEYKDGWINYFKKGNADAGNTAFKGLLKENLGLKNKNLNDKFLNIANEVFIKDGYTTPYEEFEEEMLQKTIPWYNDYKQGNLKGKISDYLNSTDYNVPANDNILNEAKTVTDENAAMAFNYGQGWEQKRQRVVNNILKSAKDRLNKLYYGEGGASNWTQFKASLFGGIYAFGYMSDMADEIKAAGKQKDNSQIGLQDLHFQYMQSNQPGVKAINSIEGGIGGEYGGMEAIANYINPLSYNSSYYIGSKSVLENLVSVADKVQLSPESEEGYTSEISETGLGTTSEEVLSKVRDFGQYFYKNWDPKKDDYIPTFSLRYLPGYKGGDELHRVNIKFDKEWLKEQDWAAKYEDGKKNTELTNENIDRLMTNGVTLYLPTEYANNYVEQNSHRTILDKVIDITGEYNFGEYIPNVGNLKLRRTKATTPSGEFINTYRIEGSIELFGSDGQVQSLPPEYFNNLIDQSLMSSTDAGKIVDFLTPELQSLSSKSAFNKLMYLNKQGTKDVDYLKSN